MRVFIGTCINLNKICSAKELQKMQKTFNCLMKWVENENIHLTWKFIGEIEEEKVNKIVSTIQDVVCSGIEIEFGKFEIWPNKKFPRQLVITGTDLDNRGAILYKNLNRELKKYGIKSEKRSFNPHITIARFKIKEKLAEPLIVPEKISINKTIIGISELNLIQSHLSHQGPTYEILKTFTI